MGQRGQHKSSLSLSFLSKEKDGNHQLGTLFFVHHRTLSEVERE